MRRPTGALALASAIVGVGLLGLALEAGVKDVARVENAVTADTRFTSETHLCPPRVGGSGYMWAATGEEPARVGFEPQQQETRDVPAEAVTEQAAFEEAVDVVAYNAPVGASSALRFTEPVAGAGAAACAQEVSDEWYFARGSAANESPQDLILYNPFPEESVVQVTIFGREGPNSPARLSDESVDAKSIKVIQLRNFIPDSDDLVGTRIVVKRGGRIVAWRRLSVGGDDETNGVEFSLGATSPANFWYFPDGAVSDSATTELVLVNPGTAEAVAQVSLPSSKGSLQPPGLEEISIPPETARRIDLSERLRRQNVPPAFGIIVRSPVGEVVAERSVVTTGDFAGRSSEVGSRVSAESWLLPPATPDTTGDRLAVINPGTEAVDLRITLTREEGSPVEPEPLQVRVRPGHRVGLSLEKWANQGPFTVFVRASGPVVAERASYRDRAGDPASAIGVPLSEEASRGAASAGP